MDASVVSAETTLAHRQFWQRLSGMKRCFREDGAAPSRLLKKTRVPCGYGHIPIASMKAWLSMTPVEGESSAGSATSAGSSARLGAREPDEVGDAFACALMAASFSIPALRRPAACRNGGATH